MTPESKLDHILKSLYERYKEGHILYLHSKAICELAKLTVPPAEAYLIMVKLNSDGYVDGLETNQWMFKINYEGILFFQEGGYKAQLRDKKRKRIKEDIYNIITATGAIIAGLYAIWQVYIELTKHK